MNRLWSSIDGIAVTLEDSERALGKINGVFMNPETGQIIAFLVGLTKVLSPVDIELWGREKIQIRNEEDLTFPTDILRLNNFGLRHCLLNSKRVRSKLGKNMGKIRNFTMDTRTDFLLTFEVAKRFLGIEWDKRIFPYKDISEVTEKAIILDVEPEDTEKVIKPALA